MSWQFVKGRSAIKGAGLALLFCAIPACRGNDFKYPPAWELGGQTFAYHGGPLVSAGEEGPRRHIPALLDAVSQVDKAPSKTLDADWKSIRAADSEVGLWWWGLTEGDPKRIVVIHTETAWEELQAGANAWGRAQQTAQIFPPEKVGVVLVHGPVDQAAELVQTRLVSAKKYGVVCWPTVEGPLTTPCTLVRGPDPDAPVANQKGQGWTLLLRLGLVDAGLVCRPWKSLEVPFEKTAGDLAIAERGWVYARLVLGDSEIDPAETDQPAVNDSERAMLALWSAVQCIAAGSPTDLDRYLRSIQLEGRLRANESDEASLGAWKAWLKEARLWVRSVALGWPE